ncbi:MAG: PepSY-associated TM helix domain-containing protein [Kangiellaceae bacterium]
MKRTKRSNGFVRKLRALHRDIGYFCIGMTAVFSISGLAVNHIDDWNPNYQVDLSVKKISINKTQQNSADLDQLILQQLEITKKIKTNFWESESRYKLFLEKDTTVFLNFNQQQATIETVTPRPIIASFNKLHLNEVSQAWVYFSDFFAILLLFLAISALFMVKGKNSVWGIRGGWVVAGIIVPLAFLFI